MQGKNSKIRFSKLQHFILKWSFSSNSLLFVCKKMFSLIDSIDLTQKLKKYGSFTKLQNPNVLTHHTYSQVSQFFPEQKSY